MALFSAPSLLPRNPLSIQARSTRMLLPPTSPSIGACSVCMLFPQNSPSIRACSVRMSESTDNLSMEQIATQVMSNLNEGELSRRGEGWAIGQASLLLGVVFAPPKPIVPTVEVVVGLASIAVAATLATAAVSDLGFVNLTPWPAPVKRNALKTEGVYSLCRHPMYSSLIAGCFGLSLLDQSFERLLLTAALFALLSFKVGQEEAFLSDKHGERYRAYAAFVPQFFPTISAVKNYIQVVLRARISRK
mmetsp:Transcript_68681/g.153234  ORF Transcript_68681/g.153234 Transcript_68681/m.153234 type:complete len:247 (-) Transcript_68681:155-895(-)